MFATSHFKTAPSFDRNASGTPNTKSVLSRHSRRTERGLHSQDVTTKQQAHVLLFSSDLNAEKMIDYYSLRFQIEFNFRDAKQYWGLQDFMNVNKIVNGCHESPLSVVRRIPDGPTL